MFAHFLPTRRRVAGAVAWAALGAGGVTAAQTPALPIDPSAPGVVVLGNGGGVASPAPADPVDAAPAVSVAQGQSGAPAPYSGGTSPTASPSSPGAASSSSGGPGSPAQGATPPGSGASPDDPCDPCGNLLKKVPLSRPMPRPGFFPVPPTGCGYYSLLDALTGNALQAPPKYPYPRTGIIANSFFDADFRYLDDPKNTEHDIYDPLKRIRLGDCWMFTTGGDLRNRYENQVNSRLTQADNTFNLSRVRTYGDLWYKDQFRVYAEFIGAYSNFQDLPRQLTDQNQADFLNLFVDAKIAELGGKPVYARVGRQELLFGSQRLISPLDWANTRRTFQGVRAFRQSENFDFDAFWVQPVVPNSNHLDSVDNNQNFVGLWGTYRPAKGQTLDLYYLMLDNTNQVIQQGVNRGNFTLNTFGSRYVGDKDGFLWDFEAAMQLGSQARQNVIAEMAVAGLGYNFKDVAMNPTFWAYYDFASGDGRPNAGTSHTFNQLFPFNHYYFGWLDQVGRQNIHDFNLHMYLYPTKWMQFQLQYHNFYLASAQDALYNAAGNAIRRDPTGRSGTHVGQELDFILNFHLTKHADLLTGYSVLYGGEFLQKTAGPNAAANSSFTYVQMSYRW